MERLREEGKEEREEEGGDDDGQIERPIQRSPPINLPSTWKDLGLWSI